MLTLLINQPSVFAGALDILQQGASFGGVVFSGLQATSGELLNGVLDLYNGATRIDSTKMTGQIADLTLDQTSAGVGLSQNHLFPAGTGAVALPLGHIS